MNLVIIRRGPQNGRINVAVAILDLLPLIDFRYDAIKIFRLNGKRMSIIGCQCVLVTSDATIKPTRRPDRQNITAECRHLPIDSRSRTGAKRYHRNDSGHTYDNAKHR